jgi:hypothetical protein
MIGFTTSRASVAEPAPADVNFEDLFGAPAPGGEEPVASPPNK